MDLELYSRFLIAQIGVLALIGLLTWLARRFGLGGKLVPNKGPERRLSIVEVMTLDSRRKLVLLRRDATEHLVLLGSGQDVLVESGIDGPAIGAPEKEAPEADEPGYLRVGEPR